MIWVGLILFCLASVTLFGIARMVAVVMQPVRIEFLKGVVPLIVGGIVFLILGFYMMMSGRRQQAGNNE